MQLAWICSPVNSGFLRVLKTTFQNVFLSLITSNSLTQFALNVKHLFAFPTHKIFKVAPFVSLAAVDVMLFAASATSAGNYLNIGLKNLFTTNVHISHNWKQYSTVSENCNTLFHFFLFFLAHDLAHNMLCLGGPARGRVCQLLFIVYKKRVGRLP